MEENNLNRERESESRYKSILKSLSPVGVGLRCRCLVFGHRFVDMPEPSAYLQRDKVMISDSKAGNWERTMMRAGLGGGDMFVKRDRGVTVEELMREVVEELDLNVRYVREGFLRDRAELYNDSPGESSCG